MTIIKFPDSNKARIKRNENDTKKHLLIVGILSLFVVAVLMYFLTSIELELTKSKLQNCNEQHKSLP